MGSGAASLVFVVIMKPISLLVPHRNPKPSSQAHSRLMFHGALPDHLVYGNSSSEWPNASVNKINRATLTAYSLSVISSLPPHDTVTRKTPSFAFFKVTEQIQGVQIKCPVSVLTGLRRKTDWPPGLGLDHRVGCVLHCGSASSVVHANNAGPVCFPRECPKGAYNNAA